MIYLALGTNLGDRRRHLEVAIAALAPQVRVVKTSPIYETEPWGYADQPRFLNQVIAVQTDLAPLELLDFIKGIESRLGRTPTFRYGPRVIDIDILLYNNLVLNDPRLAIPHPRLAERPFVLVPLADLAPDLEHPLLGLTVRQLCSLVDASSVHPLKE